jgi:phosphate transport system substrate-binding protein
MKRVFYYPAILLMACSQPEKNLKIKGSDTEVNVVAQLIEAFYKNNHTHQLSISGGGSGLGIASLLNGTADIANSSRNINEKEAALFRKKGMALDSFVFARDAVVFVVSERLLLDSILLSDLVLVLNGTYTNWAPLTGRNLPTNIYGRQSNSGTYEYIRHKLGIHFSARAKEMNGNAQILEAIKADPSGIGYVGAGYVIHGGVQGIKVLRLAQERGKQAVSPFDTAVIAQGAYPFQRPLMQYFNATDRKKIQAFFDFEKSPEGLRIIRNAGYYAP